MSQHGLENHGKLIGKLTWHLTIRGNPRFTSNRLALE